MHDARVASVGRRALPAVAPMQLDLFDATRIGVENFEL
jgi:hypothetical protein